MSQRRTARSPRTLVWCLLTAAVGVLNLAPKCVAHRDLGPPPEVAADDPLAPDPVAMVERACTGGVCRASDIVAYWRCAVPFNDDGDYCLGNWEDYALHRTVTFTESGGVLGFSVTDEAGRDATLEMEAGRPVILKLVNPAGAASSHFFTAPEFYRAVAWWRVQTEHAEYEAPSFDTFELLLHPTQDREVTLYFVPMIGGDYSAYCEDGVTGGTHYRDTEPVGAPVLGTGHAGADGAAMATTVRIHPLGSDVQLDQQPASNWSPQTARDPARYGSAALWQSSDGAPAYDRRYFDDPIVLLEYSDEEYGYGHGLPAVGEPEALREFVLRVGTGYRLKFVNLPSQAAHTFTAPEFFAGSTMLQSSDTHVSLRADHLNSVRVVEGHSAEVWLAPKTVGEFSPYCKISVQGTSDEPDLDSGHAGLGMVLSLEVAGADAGAQDAGTSDSAGN